MNQPAPQAEAPKQPPKTASAMQVVCTSIQAMEPQLKAALPARISVEKFTRVALQGIQTHKDKNKLLGANRQTLYNSISKAATDGLQLDGREAALTVFHNKDTKEDEVVYMPMTQGLVKLARNSGEIKNIIAEVVYSKDFFQFTIGEDEKPKHKPNWFDEDRGEPVGVWALVSLDNGEHIHAILPKSKVMKIASKSKNSYQYDPAKGLYFDEWWKKTAVKNVLKYAPKSTELENLIAHDDEEFIDGEGNVVTMPAQAAPAKTRKSKTADAVKAVAADQAGAPAPDLLNTAPPQAAPAPAPQPAPAPAPTQAVQDAEYTEEEPAQEQQAEAPAADQGGEEIPLM